MRSMISAALTATLFVTGCGSSGDKNFAVANIEENSHRREKEKIAEDGYGGLLITLKGYGVTCQRGAVSFKNIDTDKTVDVEILPIGEAQLVAVKPGRYAPFAGSCKGKKDLKTNGRYVGVGVMADDIKLRFVDIGRVFEPIRVEAGKIIYPGTLVLNLKSEEKQNPDENDYVFFSLEDERQSVFETVKKDHRSIVDRLFYLPLQPSRYAGVAPTVLSQNGDTEKAKKKALKKEAKKAEKAKKKAEKAKRKEQKKLEKRRKKEASGGAPVTLGKTDDCAGQPKGAKKKKSFWARANPVSAVKGVFDDDNDCSDVIASAE